MQLYTAAYVRDLSGVGAQIYGARWNQKGTAVLYTASNPALATVKLLVRSVWLAEEQERVQAPQLLRYRCRRSQRELLLIFFLLGT